MRSSSPVNGSATPVSGRGLAALFSTVALVSLAACGGGGGGSPQSQPQGSPPPSPSPSPAPSPESTFVSNADAFLFQVGSTVATDAALATVAGGTNLFKSWDPVAGQMLTPGMKINFFGMAPDCQASIANGPVASATTVSDTALLSAMAMPAMGAFTRDWQPSGASSQCNSAAQSLVGPSHVVMTADATGGAVGLSTRASTAGGVPFFGAYGASGQNGLGANAFNTSSFVTFRIDWVHAPRHPWVPAAAGQANVARIFSRQSIGSVSTIAPANATLPVQAKQFISVQFINNACASLGITASRPCSVKYLLPTAIVQANVTNWASVGWFGKARVWFDPAQGGMPIVEASPSASGSAMNDIDTGLPVYTSAGAAAGHAVFADQPFDVRISFAQLQNVMRIIAARQGGTTWSLVTDAQVAAAFGPGWNDPATWSFVSAAIGQEVHNPYSDGSSSIGGQFRSIYVGPQA